MLTGAPSVEQDLLFLISCQVVHPFIMKQCIMNWYWSALEGLKDAEEQIASRAYECRLLGMQLPSPNDFLSLARLTTSARLHFLGNIVLESTSGSKCSQASVRCLLLMVPFLPE